MGKYQVIIAPEVQAQIDKLSSDNPELAAELQKAIDTIGSNPQEHGDRIYSELCDGLLYELEIVQNHPIKDVRHSINSFYGEGFIDLMIDCNDNNLSLYGVDRTAKDLLEAHDDNPGSIRFVGVTYDPNPGYFIVTFKGAEKEYVVNSGSISVSAGTITSPVIILDEDKKDDTSNGPKA